MATAVETKGLAPDSARVFVDQIKVTFPNGEIDHGKYVKLIDELTGNDPDDLIHLAAAIAGHVDVIMTNNVDDFVNATIPFSYRRPAIMRPDEYFLALVEEGLGADLRAITIDMARRCTSPPMAWDEVLDRLGVVGLRSTIQRLRSS